LFQIIIILERKIIDHSFVVKYLLIITFIEMF